MSVPRAAQLRALIYLLEHQQNESAESHENLFWRFLTTVHPAEVDHLRGQRMALLHDLYGEEFQAWRVARLAADEGSEGFIWRMAHGRI